MASYMLDTNKSLVKKKSSDFWKLEEQDIISLVFDAMPLIIGLVGFMAYQPL